MRPTILTTTRCELVPLARATVDAFHRLITDPHVRRYLTDGVSVSRSFCERAVDSSDALFVDHGVGLWLARPRAGGAYLGFCGFRVFAELQPEPQLLYAIAPAHVGRGLATELGGRLVEHARDRAGWRTLYAAVDAPNAASRRVLAKLEFTIVARRPGAHGDLLMLERRL